VESLRTYSRSTADLLRFLQEFVLQESADAARTLCADIAHFDFSPANVLVDREQITGVVDWEGVHAGDRVFDLATLLFYSTPLAATRDYLWHVALERRPGTLGVYLAHMTSGRSTSLSDTTTRQQSSSG
jgi:aminoglycoside phosphotransferase (APT) family kinase protein